MVLLPITVNPLASTTRRRKAAVSSLSPRIRLNGLAAMTIELTDAQLVERCRRKAGGVGRARRRFSRYVYAIACARTDSRRRRRGRLSRRVRPDVRRLKSVRDDTAIRPWLAQTTRKRVRRPASRRHPSSRPRSRSPTRWTRDRTPRRGAGCPRGGRRLSPNCREMLDRFFARDGELPSHRRSARSARGTIASRNLAVPRETAQKLRKKPSRTRLDVDKRRPT